MMYNINEGVIGIQWGGQGEWGISRCPSNYPFKFTPFCGWGGREGTEYNKVENF